MKAEESHSGSHAAHAARWDADGRRLSTGRACHPMSACLHLKQVEAKARGETITVADVSCSDVRALIPAFLGA